MMSLLLTGIGSLVTNDPARGELRWTSVVAR